MTPHRLIKQALEDLKDLTFDTPVTHVYNPLDYAASAYKRYLTTYGTPPKEIMFLGMNPGEVATVLSGFPVSLFCL